MSWSQKGNAIIIKEHTHFITSVLPLFCGHPANIQAFRDKVSTSIIQNLQCKFLGFSMIRKKTRTGMMEYFYNNQLNHRSLRKLVDRAIAQEIIENAEEVDEKLPSKEIEAESE